MSALALWTVYDHPTDYPDKYVARRFEVHSNRIMVTSSVIVMDDLKKLRDVLQFEMHLTCLKRDPKDDPNIVEVWL